MVLNVGDIFWFTEEQEARQLTAENAQLTQEVERLKQKLIALEIRNGSKTQAEFILTTQAFFHRFLACAFSFFDLTN